jgi:hypothetical protein
MTAKSKSGLRFTLPKSRSASYLAVAGPSAQQNPAAQFPQPLQNQQPNQSERQSLFNQPPPPPNYLPSTSGSYSYPEQQPSSTSMSGPSSQLSAATTMVGVQSSETGNQGQESISSEELIEQEHQLQYRQDALVVREGRLARERQEILVEKELLALEEAQLQEMKDKVKKRKREDVEREDAVWNPNWDPSLVESADDAGERAAF